MCIRDRAQAVAQRPFVACADESARQGFGGVCESVVHVEVPECFAYLCQIASFAAVGEEPRHRPVVGESLDVYKRQHNLSEVVDACCAYIDNPEITGEEMLQYIKGPDFPTGCLLYTSRCV